jgi:hypothetical protein
MADVLNPTDNSRRSGNESVSSINLVDLAQPGKSTISDRQKTQAETAPPETVLPRSATLLPHAETVTVPAASINSFHLTRPPVDADLQRKYDRIDPGTWVNEAPFHDYYENGVVKLLTDPNGRQQFGLRISDQRSDRVPIVPIGRPHLNDKGVALEFKLKF